MKAASKKQKGAALERKIAGRYRKTGLFSDARRQLLSGGGFMKGDIWTKERNEFCEEVKKQETVKLGEWWGQTLSQTSPQEKPLLHISANYRPIISVLLQDDWQDIVWELGDYGVEYQWDPVVITKKRFNLWNEWDNVVEATSKYCTPLMYIDKEEPLAVMWFEDLLELRLKLKQGRLDK